VYQLVASIDLVIHIRHYNQRAMVYCNPFVEQLLPNATIDGHQILIHVVFGVVAAVVVVAVDVVAAVVAVVVDVATHPVTPKGRS